MDVNYEQIAASVKMPGDEPSTKRTRKVKSEPKVPKPEPVEIDPSKLANHKVRESVLAAREFLPLDHAKYRGIAASKGYAQGDEFSGNRLQRVHYSHEAMIEVIIQEPTITQGELAKRFDRSQSWISIVMGSDAFQAALAKRRDDIMNPEIIASVEERLNGLAHRSLQVLAEKLDKPEASADLALEALKVSTKALGMGARNGTVNNTLNNFVVALPEKAESSSDWLRDCKPRQIEGNSDA